MTMETEFVKRHEGTVHNSTGSFPSVPWWSATGTGGSQSTCKEPFGQLKSLPMEEEHQGGNQPTVTKLSKKGTEQGTDKGNATPFTIFTGDGQKPQLQVAIPTHSNLLEHQHRFELAFSQPAICAQHPFLDHFYGVFSAYGPHAGHLMLPLNMTTDDGPIYVNAKQYHGIIRRRQCRAKAELENKALKARKPYMHESRHLHALRRPRGCGGRFLNMKKSTVGTGKGETKNGGDGQLSMAAGSQNSEVLQSDSVNLNLFKEEKANGSHLPGSEITSMYSRKDVGCFSYNYLKPSVRSISDMISSGHSKWVGAADHCSNLNI